ncbi:MAG: glycosyltransferase [Clostridiales bacterium]|nr:glycosyltransferase [Clostridiales bacterium]
MKKIMQCLMGLDIGGAETHVVELSKGLKARGYEVMVASNGGIYEKELIQAGVQVVTIPMHSKNPIYVLKSLSLLYKNIRSFKPDVVHAHARIPALYVSIMKKLLKFRMMTTVHGKFKINWVLKKITQWGEEIFVVSEDIESYLLENYDLKGAPIYQTINGIDTEKFKREAVAYPYKKLIHVSRLEKDTSKMAGLLIGLAAETDLDITVVGGGEMLKELKSRSSGLANIEFTGPTDRVDDMLKQADVFVGISRAALEAMSMNMPVILSGEYGAMGILSEDKLKTAIGNNFTARVNTELTYEDLKRDIEALRLMPPQAFDWEREFTEKNYSVGKMVDDYVKVYANV